MRILILLALLSGCSNQSSMKDMCDNVGGIYKPRQSVQYYHVGGANQSKYTGSATCTYTKTESNILDDSF